jgi:hypothetical protein
MGSSNQTDAWRFSCPRTDTPTSESTYSGNLAAAETRVNSGNSFQDRFVHKRLVEEGNSLLELCLLVIIVCSMALAAWARF